MNVQTFRLSVLVFATLVAVGSASAACSNATLKGVVGVLDTGFNAGVPEVTLAQTTFDGSGKVSGTLTNSTNGTITTSTFTGIYSVSTNCSGSFTLKFPNGSTAHTNFVLDNVNQGLQTIRADNGLVKSGFGVVQGTAVCGLSGTSAVFAGNLSGAIIGAGQIAGTGRLILDGKGHISGMATFSVNGAITKGTVAGTYTETAGCTGTAQITPPGLMTGNFNFVVVNGGKEILLIKTDNDGSTVSGTLQQ